MTPEEANARLAHWTHLRNRATQPKTGITRKRHLGQINQTEPIDPSRERVWVRRVILKRQES